MTRIVTCAHRPKRPPQKKQAAPLAGPAAVTRRAWEPEAVPAAVTGPPPANDDRKAATSAHDATKSAIVATTSRKQQKLRREARALEDHHPDDPEAPAAMRAWLERAMRGRGPAG
jgi:hypothetical protein